MDSKKLRTELFDTLALGIGGKYSTGQLSDNKINEKFKTNKM